jgi:hypothetical protein
MAGCFFPSTERDPPSETTRAAAAGTTVGCPSEPSTATIDDASNHGHAADTAASARVAPKAAFNATSKGEIPVGELCARPPAIALASTTPKTRRTALSGL